MSNEAKEPTPHFSNYHPTTTQTDELRSIITKLRAGKDPDTGELHISESEALALIEAEISKREAQLLDELELAVKLSSIRVKSVEDFINAKRGNG